MNDLEIVAPFEASPELDRTVRDLLVEVDDEYVPRLSDRTDTMALRPVAGSPGITAYLEAMRAESWLVARREGSVVGVMSFRRRHQDPHLEPYSPSLYRTTILVPHHARGTGVASVLYGGVEQLAAEDGLTWVTTRTWTTNTDQRARLARRGYRVFREVPDDRGPGIGSVYLVKQVGIGSG